MVRNRYLRIERGRMLTEQGLSKNRCGQCGELKRGHVCRVPRTVISSNSLPQQQAARDHMVARARGLLDACATASAELTAPLTPGGSSDGGRTTLALGGAAPLTMQFAPGEGSDGGPTSTMSSPGPLSTHMSLGLSPLHNATPGGGLSFGAPPSLRTQNSMDILLQASEVHRTRGADSVAPTPLASEFEHNPFKLPTVRARRARHASLLQTSPLPSPTSLTHRLLPPSPIFSQVKSSELPEELRENPTAEQQPASITKECDATTVVEYAVNQGSDDGSSSSPSDGSDGGVHLPVTEVVTVN